MFGQETKDQYLARINAQLPHQFKELKTRATLEAIRELGVVKLYMLIDDIEQYEQILVERSDEAQKYFSQCKQIDILPGKFKNNYLETIDKYPVSSRMTNLYRLKAISKEGFVCMFAPIAISVPETSQK